MEELHPGCQYCTGLLSIFKACPLYLGLSPEQALPYNLTLTEKIVDGIMSFASFYPYFFGIVTLVSCVYFRTTRLSVLAGLAGGSGVLVKIFQKGIQSARPSGN